ncbi:MULTISPECIES: GTPase family protein [Methylomonas]|uniref:GTPase family protein n=1 Tax=Methylomonas TaxID=416 RepID=UPI0012327CE4|nr:GTPase [Methylomonas rhizoryzae]
MNLFGKWSWYGLGNAIFAPKADGLEAKLDEVKQKLPIPVFWLLGKAQSGKTSIIRALTGSADAVIGNGFQACTRRSRFYDFPSSSHPLIRFLDTRGLGESAYDPAEDLAWCAEQAHLLLVVLRASDMNQADVVAGVAEIHAKHPKWPIVVAQTVLHEVYPAADDEHIQPYPYAQSPLPPQVPHRLVQSLLHQRAWFKDLPAQFVALDFTLPEDGFTPANYGLEALWDTVEAVFPDGVLSLLRGSEQHRELMDFHAQLAQPHLIGYALLNLGVGAIPLAGLPLVLGVQAKLFHSIASLYGLPLTRSLYLEFTTLIGTGVGVGMLGREVLKWLPVYGWAVAGLYSGAMTYALGKAFCLYLQGVKRGALPDEAAIRLTYSDAFKQAKQLLKQRRDT